MTTGTEGIAEVVQQDVCPALIVGLGRLGREVVEALALFTTPGCRDLRLFQTVILERVSGEGGWLLEAGGEREMVPDWSELHRRLAERIDDASRTDAVREAVGRGLRPNTTTRYTYLVAGLGDEARADILALCYLLRVVSVPQGQIAAHNCLLLQIPSILDMSQDVRAGAYATLKEIDHTVRVLDYPAPWGRRLAWPPFHCSWLFLHKNQRNDSIAANKPKAHLLAAALAAFLSPGVGQAVHDWHVQHALLPPEIQGSLGAYGSCGVAILDLPLPSVRERLAQDLKARVISQYLLADREGLTVQPTPAQFLRDHNLTEESCQDLLPAAFHDTLRARLVPWAFPLDPEDSLLERLDTESGFLEDEIISARKHWDGGSSDVAASLRKDVQAYVGDVIDQSLAGIKVGRSVLERVAQAVSGLTSTGSVRRSVQERREKVLGVSDQAGEQPGLLQEKQERRELLQDKLWELKALFERRFLPQVASHVFSLLMGVAALVVFPWLFVRTGQAATGQDWTPLGGIVLGLAAACLLFGAYLEWRWSGQLGSALLDVYHRGGEVPQTRALGMALAALTVVSGLTVLMVIGPFDWSAEDFRFRWLIFGSLLFLAGTGLTWVGPMLAAVVRDVLRGGARIARRRQAGQLREDLPDYKSLKVEGQEQSEQEVGPRDQEGWQAEGLVDAPPKDVPDSEEYPWQRSLIHRIAARFQTIVFWWAVLIVFPIFLAMTLLSPAKERGTDLGLSEFLGLLASFLISARWETVLVLVLGLGLMAIAIDVLTHLLMWSLQRRQVAQARHTYLTAVRSYLAELLDLQRFYGSAIILDALSALLKDGRQHLQDVEDGLARQVEPASKSDGPGSAEVPDNEASRLRPAWIPALDLTNEQELEEFLTKCLGGAPEIQMVEVTQQVVTKIRDGRLFENWRGLSDKSIMVEVEAQVRVRIDALVKSDLEEVFLGRHDEERIVQLRDEMIRFCAPWWIVPDDTQVAARMAGPVSFVAVAAKPESVRGLFPQARVVPIADRLRCVCLDAEQHLPLTCLPDLEELREAYKHQDEEAKDKLHTLADWRNMREIGKVSAT